MASVVEIAIRGIDEATKVFEDVGSSAQKSMEQAEASVNAVDDSINNVSDLDVSTGSTESSMQRAEDSIEGVQDAIQETESVGQGFSDRMSSAFDKVAEKWMEITAVASTAGIAIESMGGKQKDLTEQTTRVAEAMGTTSDEIRASALEITNVTFPIEDVLDLMETGRQQGIESTEQLKEYATFWDTVGDATGLAGPELAKASAGLRAVGISAGEESEALSAFGYITENTTGNVNDFLSFLERTGPQLNEMGMNVDDAAAMLGVLEHEFGMSGRTARQEFRKAVNEADGDMGALMETLGVSDKTFNQYKDSVEGSSNVIERNADIHAESYTVMDKLQQKASELMYNYGDFIGIASNLAPVLMALGPAIKVVNGATAIFNATLWASPITWIIAGIVALIAVIALLWKNWDQVSAWLSESWQWIKDVAVELFSGLGEFFTEFWDWLKELFIGTWEAITEFLTVSWEWIKETASTIFESIGDFFSGIWDWIMNIFSSALDWIDDKTFGAFSIYFDTIKYYLEMIWGIVQDVWEYIKNTFRNALDFLKALVTLDFEGMKDAIKNQMDNVWNLVKNIWNRIKDFFSNTVSGIRDNVTKVFENIKDKLGGIWQGISDMAGKVWGGMVDIIKAPVNTIIGIVNAFINGINSVKIESPKIPDWVPKFGGKSFSIGFNIPNIPQLAEGGLVSDATLALIGEGRDREAVLPLNNNVMGTLADMIVGNMGVQGGQPIDYKILAQEIANAMAKVLIPELSKISLADLRIIIQKMEMNNDYDVLQLSRELKRLIDKANKSSGKGWG